MSDDPFRLAIIRGGVARAAGELVTANPFGMRTALGLCWAHGWRRARETVSRETTSQKPGRGRPLVGDRGEWGRAQERDLATLLTAGASQRLAGEIIERSHQAVRVHLSRQRKRAA